MLAPDAKLIHYVLEYNSMNMNGTEDIGGTENRLIITEGEEIRLEGLIAGSVYNVRVKVKCSAWVLTASKCRSQQRKEKVSSHPVFSS